MTKEELKTLLLEYYEYIKEVSQDKLLKNWWLLKKTDEFVKAHKSQLKPQEGENNLFSDDKFIGNVCLSYRHDFGLMSKDEKDKLIFECKEWMRAIKNNANSSPLKQ